MGLYFKTSIVLFYIPIIAVHLIKKNINVKDKQFNYLNPKRYLRYVKLIISYKVIILIIFVSIISNSIVIYQNNKYESLYKNIAEIEGEAIVISNKKEKKYNDIYKIKIIYANNCRKYKNTYLYLRINKSMKKNLDYGDKIKFNGNFIEPEIARNYQGFNYKEYLKTIKIYGTIKCDYVDIIEKDKVNLISRISNKISMDIERNIDEIIGNEETGIVKGIILGDKNDIDEEMQEDFKTSGISHILAISGMHVSYIVIAINLFFKKKIGNRNTKIFIILFLIIYMFITGFSPSIVRAGLMSMLLIGSEIFYRKNDLATSIGLSLLIIVIYNPFLLKSVGLQFSYIGTIGIIVLNKNIKNILKRIKIRNKKWKYSIKTKNLRLIKKVQDILSVTIAAQASILPIMIFHFNVFNTYFLITNLLVSIIIGPLLVFSVLGIVSSFIYYPLAKVISCVLTILAQFLINVSKFSQLPFSKIYFPTPTIYIIVSYYIVLLLSNFKYKLYNAKSLNNTQIRVRNLIALIKYKFFIYRKTILKLSIFFISIIVIFKFIPKDLNIHFIDVGQGDCTFIVTPFNKTILIDGGGSHSSEYDVGKSTLLPYILDRGYTKIDYMIVSHFDQDHVGRIINCDGRVKSKASNYK